MCVFFFFFQKQKKGERGIAAAKERARQVGVDLPQTTKGHRKQLAIRPSPTHPCTTPPPHPNVSANPPGWGNVCYGPGGPLPARPCQRWDALALSPEAAGERAHSLFARPPGCSRDVAPIAPLPARTPDTPQRSARDRHVKTSKHL